MTDDKILNEGRYWLIIGDANQLRSLRERLLYKITTPKKGDFIEIGPRRTTIVCPVCKEESLDQIGEWVVDYFGRFEIYFCERCQRYYALLSV